MPALASRDGKNLHAYGKVPVNVNILDAPGGAVADEWFQKLDS